MKSQCAPTPHLANAVQSIIAAYDEELAIVRRERDQANDRARQATGQAEHWRSNHADMVARCALLRQRPDLPVDRVVAFGVLEALQARFGRTRHALAKAIVCLNELLESDNARSIDAANRALPHLRQVLDEAMQ